MDEKSSKIVKQKIISSSKLRKKIVKSSEAHADETFGHHVYASSLNSEIASINFGHALEQDQIATKHFGMTQGESGQIPPRFNPFDKDQDSNSEDSFEESQKRHSIESLDGGLAELGITENHFSYGDNHLGLSSVEELEAAIQNCKDMILKLPEGSKKKKSVENLVELKIKLQELKDRPSSADVNTKNILGHKLKKQNNRTFKNFCDCCRGSIFSLMQAWYECKECSYICHEKCLNSIRRVCIAKAATTSNYELNICPEVGLSKQHYCCMECKNPISTGDSDTGLLCDYNGLYYCSNCHWNDSMVIPARVVHNWDFEPRKVCRQSYQLLSRMYTRPILNLEQINQALFNYVEELAEIRRMRENIIKMKEYLSTCTAALDAKLFWKLASRQHFVDNSNMYSLKDVVDIHNMILTDELTKIHIMYSKHIKLDCLVCQGKGFYCEICKSGEALFPFDMMVSICISCSAVFHSDCYSFVDKLCPRCRRKQEKRKRSFSYLCGSAALSSTDDEAEDFPCTEKSADQAPFSAWMTSNKDSKTTNKTEPPLDVGRSSGDLADTTPVKPIQTELIQSNASSFYPVETVIQFNQPALNAKKKEPVLKDRARKQSKYLPAASRVSKSSASNPARISEVYDDHMNPFVEQSSNNPFLEGSTIYEESKNPFCCD